MIYALARTAGSNGFLFVEYLVTLAALAVVAWGIRRGLRLRGQASEEGSTDPRSR